MNTAGLFWIIVYCSATLLFFGCAAVITVVGARDLKELLSRSTKKH